MVGADHTPAPDGPNWGVPMLVTPVLTGGPTRYAFQMEPPSLTRSAVTLPRKVQHAYWGSIERVSSQDAAGMKTTPSCATGAPVSRVASCSSTRFLHNCLPVVASTA